MKNVMKIIRGLPASGKSTIAYAWVAEDPNRRVRLNRDDLRLQVYGRYHLVFENDAEDGSDRQRRENFISKLFKRELQECFRNHKDIVVDNTNLSSREVRSLFELADAAGYDVEVIDVEISVDEAVRRDSLRERVVGEEVIRAMAARYLHKGKLPKLPELKSNRLISEAVYVAPKRKPKAVILDMDGTAALLGKHEGARSPYDETRVLEDSVNKPVHTMIRLLKADGHRILVTSGRSGAARADTMKWLDDNGYPWDKMFMRKVDDKRSDDIVKLELFNQFIRDEYDVRAVFDDRLQVCRVWHSLGLPLFRVGDPDANF